MDVANSLADFTYNNLNKTNLSSNQSNVKYSCNINRNSSSNAILAQLKSISPNFKSIFVRPKNSKHIDSSIILNKVKLNSNNKNEPSLGASASIKNGANSMTSILNLLYNNSANINNNNTSAANQHFPKIKENAKEKLLESHFLMDSSTRLVNILPNTEPRELHLNSSVDELLNKFSNEGNAIYFK
jgi:hypothetical protein